MNKLEKHIKEKLEERSIKPSEGAWERVASELSNPTKKASGNRFWYYAIAASIIGFLAFGAYYSSQSETPLPTEITTTVKDENSQPEEFPIPKTNEVANNGDAGDTNLVPSVKKHLEKPNIAPKIAEEAEVLEDYPKLDQMAINNVQSNEDVLIAEKLDAVIAKISSMEAENTLVSDAEVDSLLRIAQREILTDKAIQQNGKIDAMALLEEVEGELDQTFRDQLFEKLKDGFFKVRTAVADRNN